MLITQEEVELQSGQPAREGFSCRRKPPSPDIKYIQYVANIQLHLRCLYAELSDQESCL